MSEETTPQETTPQETTASHKTYIVQDGDTLYGIIKREYGSEDPQKLQELFDLNGPIFSGKLYIQVTQHFSQQTGRTAEQHRMWSMVTAF